MGRRPKIPFLLAICLGEERPTRGKKEKAVADTKIGEGRPDSRVGGGGGRARKEAPGLGKRTHLLRGVFLAGGCNARFLHCGC